MLPSLRNTVVHLDKGILSQAAEHIRFNLSQSGNTKINLFDLYKTNGHTVLPLLFELAQHNVLNGYAPVTASKILNQHAIRNVNQVMLVMEYQIPVDTVDLDPTVSDFKAVITDGRSRIQNRQRRGSKSIRIVRIQPGEFYPS